MNSSDSYLVLSKLYPGLLLCCFPRFIKTLSNIDSWKRLTDCMQQRDRGLCRNERYFECLTMFVMPNDKAFVRERNYSAALASVQGNNVMFTFYSTLKKEIHMQLPSVTVLMVSA